MKLIKITFLIIGLICSFVLQTMEPEQARALEQQEEYRYAAGAKQKMEQTPHMDLVWSKLAHEYYATGQIDPQLFEEFNRLRAEGQKFKTFNNPRTWRQLRQFLGITDAQWQALMPEE